MSTTAKQISKTGENYSQELTTIFETTQNSTSQTIYYFEPSDSNPLKNVTCSQITNDSATFYHTHDFYEVNYAVSGTLYQNISGRSFSLSEGELLIMPPGVFHACVPSTGSECLNLLFKKEYIKRLSNDFRQYDPNNYLSSLTENSIYTIISAGALKSELSEIILKIYEKKCILNHHVNLYENLAIENAAADFLLFLTKIPRHEYSFESGRMAKRESVSPDEIVSYINNNFDKINLSDTAIRFGYSNCQLHRIIKKHTGLTFSELILSMRMQRARHYLLNTHLPIKSIAFLLGLDSAEHFSRMFKKNRGMTPKEYRSLYMRQSLRK